MVIDRRQLLGGLIAALAASRGADAQSLPRRLFVSCRMDAANNASVACFDAEGAEIFSAALPARGHDVTVRPGTHDVAVFARRPGNWFAVVSGQTGDVRSLVHAIAGRHFFGHGAFSADARLLYATENDIGTGGGVIGIYDATDGYRRIGELPSGGIGPHDLALLPDGRSLVIANGGLRTHPDNGREILNPEGMKPNLALADLTRGEITARHELDADLSKLSIRHLAVRPDGLVAFGCQHQGGEDEAPPLLGLLRPGGTPVMLEIEDDALFRMRNYIGSVSFDDTGNYLAATSPQGGSVLVWSVARGKVSRSVMITDVSGAAPNSTASFLVTSGNTGLSTLDPSGLSPAPGGQRWIWDNHAKVLRSDDRMSL
jgi:hypothetical protein